MIEILIIEDDKLKIQRLTSFLKPYYITLKESFQSGVLELKNNYKNYDVLILDMTIPLWEKGSNDLGGNVEQFGGERILREMNRRKLFVPTILFTMFDVFSHKSGSISFEQLDTLYKKEFNPFYVGSVFYNANEEGWKNDLLALMKKNIDR